MNQFLRRFVLPYATLSLLRFFWWSWRITITEPPSLRERLSNKNPFIVVHWHGDEIPLLLLVTRYGLATMTSTSKDGELINWIIEKLGGATSRGSSTRGGVSALIGLLRLITKQKRNASVAVDGPKGPIYKVKPGVFEISRVTQSPIYWISVSADRYFQFEKAWNKAILPKPFARVYIELHGPMEPINKDSNPKDPQLALDLESKMNAAKHQASKQFNIN